MESDLGKLFIGGISWDTDEDLLRDYFRNFGEVSEAVIMRDRNTGRARGFGFIVFANPAVAEYVLTEKHTIDGRTVEVKRAVPRDDQQIIHRNNGSIQGSPAHGFTKKIFVGGLPSTVTEADFRGYFGKFGVIIDAVVMYDHNTHRPRGFGFVTYESEVAVDKVLFKNFHELNGKMVEVKKAVPKELSPGPSMRSSIGHSHALTRVNSLGMRFDAMRFERSSIPPFSRLGYRMGLNFEPMMIPNYSVMRNSNNNVGFNEMSPYNRGNSSRFTGLRYADGDNGAESFINSSSGLWENGDDANGSAFLGLFQSAQTSSLQYEGVHSRQIGAGVDISHYDLNGRPKRTYANVNSIGSIYGDPTWCSTFPVDAGPFSYDLKSEASDISVRDFPIFTPSFDVSGSQSKGGIAA